MLHGPRLTHSKVKVGKISIPLDRPRERTVTETRAFARICAMVREALGSGGGLEEDTSIKE